MLRPLLALTACGLTVAACAMGGRHADSAPDTSALWSGPPPWTLDQDDGVAPSVAWTPPPPARFQPSSEWGGSARLDCTLPAATPGAQPVAVGLYESATLSSAAVGGPDQETLFVTVDVERGKGKLDLLLTSYESMVWRLTGATGRVAHVTVSTFQHEPETGAPASGVIGAPADRLSFLTAACLPYFHDADAGRAITARLFGAAARPIVVASYSALALSVPSGRVSPDPSPPVAAPPGLDPSEWSAAGRYWPGGVVAIRPSLVRSAAGVRSYRVLPSQAGIAQLRATGAIVASPGGWRIVRAISHLPSRMTGAHSEHLTLAPGVSMPPGDPGHACITAEGGGTVGLCR